MTDCNMEEYWMSEDIVLFETIGGVAKITINRPSKYNALNTSVVSTLTEMMKKAKGNEGKNRHC